MCVDPDNLDQDKNTILRLVTSHFTETCLSGRMFQRRPWLCQLTADNHNIVTEDWLGEEILLILVSSVFTMLMIGHS